VRFLSNDRVPFDDLDGWQLHAPPARRSHWADGRSAMELAKAWVDGNAETHLAGLLARVPGFDGFSATTRIVEKKIFFDDVRRGPRNHDLFVVGSASAGTAAIGIEAKADEPFGETLETYVRRARHRSTATRAPERADLLTKTLIGRRLSADASLGELRYQLFSALAGTLVESRADGGSDLAVLLVHEFRTYRTTSQRLARNAADLEAFIHVVAPDARRIVDGPNWLVGPFTVKGGHPLWPAEQETFIAKLVTVVPPGPRK
jgi:hypothetical protein